MGDKGETRRPSGRWTHHPTKGNKKAMGEKGRQEDHREGGHTIQQTETRRVTMGDIGRQDTREGGHAIQQGETRRGTMEDKGRQDLGKTDAPSNKGKQEGAQWETKGDKTLKNADTPSNKGKQDGETRPLGRRTRHPTPRRTPNSTLFGGKRGKTCENPQASLSNSVYLDCTLERISGFSKET